MCLLHVKTRPSVNSFCRVSDSFRASMADKPCEPVGLSSEAQIPHEIGDAAKQSKHLKLL